MTQCHGGGMGHWSRLESVSIPSLEGGRVDRHPSFSLFFFTIYHLFPYFILTSEIFSNNNNGLDTRSRVMNITDSSLTLSMLWTYQVMAMQRCTPWLRYVFPSLIQGWAEWCNSLCGSLFESWSRWNHLWAGKLCLRPCKLFRLSAYCGKFYPIIFFLCGWWNLEYSLFSAVWKWRRLHW